MWVCVELFGFSSQNVGIFIMIVFTAAPCIPTGVVRAIRILCCTELEGIAIAAQRVSHTSEDGVPEPELASAGLGSRARWR